MERQNKLDLLSEDNKWLWNNITLFLAILCLNVLLWKPLNSTINAILVSPILQHVSDNSWIVMIALVFLEGIYYWTVYKRKCDRNSHIKRLIIVFEITLIYLLFRLSNEYSFYGIGEFLPAYLDVVFIIATIVEIALYCNNNKHDLDVNEMKKGYSNFLFDKPTDKDDLKRRGFAFTLVNKIKSTFPILPLEERKKKTNTSFTVLLSERYGQGKSSFFEQIKNICEEQKIDVIVFRPWLSNNPDHLIINYFDLLKEELGNYNKELRKLLQSYSVLASEHISGGIAKVASGLLNEGSIEKQHDRISSILLEEGKLRIVLIDDVDRLQSQELLALIKLVRNTADFPYIAYVVAADKVAMKDTLKKVGIADPEEYLKKFFNFELLFPADDNNIIESLIYNISAVLRKFGYSEEDIKDISIDINKNSDYYAPVFTNMRDVYRYCNILSFELDILKNHKKDNGNNIYILNDIYINDFVKICLIQYISPKMYKLFRDYRFSVLKDAGNGRLTLENSLKEFVDDRESVRRAKAMVEQITSQKKNDTKKESNNDSNQSHDNYCKIKATPKTAVDFIEKIEPNSSELLKAILAEIWEDTINYVHPKSVCYSSQYFLYFSGRYRKDEMSDNEAAELFAKTIDDFSNAENELILHKRDSMVHKLNILVLSETIDRLSLLKKIQSLAYIDYKHYCEENGFLYSGFYDFYNNREYGNIVRRLYRLRYKDDKNGIYKVHRDYFYSTNEYIFAALSLKYISRPELSDSEKLFSDEQINEFAQQTISNFFYKLFVNNPFDVKTVETIPSMRAINLKYWEELFFEYVKKTGNATEWLFRLFILNGEGGMLWNNQMFMALFGENQNSNSLPLYNLANKICNDETFEKYRDSIWYFETDSHVDSIPNTTIDSNLFLKDAYEWLKERQINT